MPQSAPGNFITIDGKRLHYVTAGDGPPVILIHGASGNLLDWTFSLFDELAKSYRILAFDRPGLGYSDPAVPHETLGSQVRLMHDAAAELGFDRATLVGHSYGGSVALKWATSKPETVSSLLLLAAPSQVWPGSAGTLYDIANTPVLGRVFSSIVPLLATKGRINSVISSIFTPQAMPEGYADHVQAVRSTKPEIYRVNAAQIGALKAEVAQMAPHYPDLKMPVHLIHGTADTIVPTTIHSDVTANQIASAKLTRLDGIGHMPHHVAPETVLSALRKLT